jgi:hypothetical protein
MAAEVEGEGEIGMTGTRTTVMVEDDMVDVDVTGAMVMAEEDTMEDEVVAEAVADAMADRELAEVASRTSLTMIITTKSLKNLDPKVEQKFIKRKRLKEMSGGHWC